MRYVLAGGVVLVGALLVGLAMHNTVGQAWQELSK